MPHIQQLSAHVADLIAAGEVVERPASVVKELVENAIDAGAHAVTVEIRSGGMSLIRVTDDGCGIAPEELPIAFLRHATSKLRTESDLGCIGTLGFRGEALAAIAAVSRLEIESRPAGTDSGARLTLEGGVPGAVEPAGVPEGTSIRVRDLFYNTPARLKFMKKDSAETAAVSGLLQHLALSHPEIAFCFVKDGTEALHTPGDGRIDSAVYAALGRDFARTLLAVEGRGGEVEVRGFVTRPLFGRGSRGMQTFFVNGRFIKSQLLTAALEEGYRNQLMKGKFPGCVLEIRLPVTAVDVNVHPAKTQVKFAREREVFDAVYHTVLDALAADNPAEVPLRPAQPAPPPRTDFFKTMDAAAFRTQGAAQPRPQAPAARPEPGPVPPIRAGFDSEWHTAAPVADAVPFRQPYAVRAPASAPAAPPSAAGAAEAPSGSAPAPAAAPPPAAPARADKPFVPAIPAMAPREELPGQERLTPETPAPWRMVGEVLHTYIICEDGQSVWLIDKHAAHERINFDRLQKAQTPPMRQTLLAPIAARLERESGEVLLENLPLLEQFGFGCEDFGGGTVLVREIPADLPADAAEATLEEFAEQLRTGRSPEEKREALLHTMACKAAIKGGWVSDPAELQVLVEQVERGAIKYCPHGRPVAVKLSKYELEKMFKRA